MRICPICSQTYADDSLNFCLIDGAGLRQINDDPQTEKFSAKQTGKLEKSTASGVWKNLVIFFLSLALLAGGVFIIWFEFIQPKNNIPAKPLTDANTKTTNSETNDKPSVTMEKYKKINPGMTYNEVVQLIGSDGEELFNTGNMGKYNMSSVRWGTPFVYIMVTLQDKKVVMKTQNGLE